MLQICVLLGSAHSVEQDKTDIETLLFPFLSETCPPMAGLFSLLVDLAVRRVEDDSSHLLLTPPTSFCLLLPYSQLLSDNTGGQSAASVAPPERPQPTRVTIRQLTCSRWFQQAQISCSTCSACNQTKVPPIEPCGGNSLHSHSGRGTPSLMTFE